MPQSGVVSNKNDLQVILWSRLKTNEVEVKFEKKRKTLLTSIDSSPWNDGSETAHGCRVI